ncbi:pilus assembly protein TadG-related protein [Phenylobacterium sp.]|uniref:pilus assembly protein TadG-related protein n=1 Tax=Phenylobacterium sp. TaxID=1871053 RepID=UPI002FE064CF
MRLGGLLAVGRALRADRAGATAITTGLLMVVGLGFVGLGVDVGAAYNARRAAQNAADSAAFSGAAAAMGGDPNVALQARAVADRYGMVHGEDGVTVEVNSPASRGAYAANPQAVEVIVTRPMKRFFAAFLGAEEGVVRARAVAVAGSAGDGCIIALNPSVGDAILINGGVTVTAAGCSVYSNSASNRSMTANGPSTVDAKSVELVGQLLRNGPGVITGPVNTGVPTVADPYRDVGVPAYAHLPCETPHIITSGQTLNPQRKPIVVYCTGLTVQTLQTVTFNPGIYVVEGPLIFNGNVVVRGDGVTFVMTNRGTGPIPSVTVNGASADIELSAPSSGPMGGILFYQDGRAGSGSNIFNGGSRARFRGALYFPSQAVIFNGGTDVTSGGCTQLIANRITFNGAARLAMDCAGMPLRGPGGSRTELVE